MSIFQDYTTACDECYKFTLPGCPESFDVNAGLDANTDYFWFIEDKFGNVYHDSFTTNGSGNFTVDTSELPVGMLNKNAGGFKFWVSESLTYQVDVDMNLGGATYPCVIIDFANSDLPNVIT